MAGPAGEGAEAVAAVGELVGTAYALAAAEEEAVESRGSDACLTFRCSKSSKIPRNFEWIGVSKVGCVGGKKEEEGRAGVGSSQQRGPPSHN